MCREHHEEQHRIGWERFLARYRKVYLLLIEIGWKITGKPGGGVYLSHPEVP